MSSRPSQPITVQVSVVDGQVQVDPATLSVQGENRTLRFQLASLGYSFPTLGAIVIEGGHKSQFPQSPVWVDAHTVTLLDRNSNRQPRSYRYTIVVLDALGRRRTLDPSIDNEGRPALVTG